MPDEFTIWLSSITLGQIVAVLAVVATVALAVWKGWPAFRKIVGLLARGIKLVDTLATLHDDLAVIRHELETNGGGSLKDAAVRTETRVAELRVVVTQLGDDLAHVKRQNAALKTSLAKTNRRLAEHIGPPPGEPNEDHEPRQVRGSTR